MLAALSAFVSSGEFNEEGLLDGRHKLWVDALCINQSDPVERGNEVRRMREIYSTAWCVIAWFGAEEESFASARGMRLVRELGALGRHAKGDDEVGVRVEKVLREEGDFLGGGGA